MQAIQTSFSWSISAFLNQNSKMLQMLYIVSKGKYTCLLNVFLEAKFKWKQRMQHNFQRNDP